MKMANQKVREMKIEDGKSYCSYFLVSIYGNLCIHTHIYIYIVVQLFFRLSLQEQSEIKVSLNRMKRQKPLLLPSLSSFLSCNRLSCPRSFIWYHLSLSVIIP